MHAGYKNDKIAVRYDPKVCIHAGECVRGLPSVFDVSKKPWIDVNGAAVDAIIEQVKRCPSGALSYEQLEGGINVCQATVRRSTAKLIAIGRV